MIFLPRYSKTCMPRGQPPLVLACHPVKLGKSTRVCTYCFHYLQDIDVTPAIAGATRLHCRSDTIALSMPRVTSGNANLVNTFVNFLSHFRFLIFLPKLIVTLKIFCIYGIFKYAKRKIHRKCIECAGYMVYQIYKIKYIVMTCRGSRNL